MKNFAKTLVAMGITTTVTLLATPAQAAENSVEPKAIDANPAEKKSGMAPDSTFYFLDKFGEKFHLFITSNAEKKSNLYLDYAEERLAESAGLADTVKDKYVADLADNYVEHVSNAQEKIGEVIVSDKVSDDVRNQLTSKLENVTTTVTDKTIDSALDEKHRTSFEAEKQEGYLFSNMVRTVDKEKVKALREQGLRFKDIVKVLAIAKETGKNENDIVKILQSNDNNFEAVEKELQISQRDIWKKIMREKAEAAEKAYEQALISGNKGEIARANKWLNKIEKAQRALGITKEDSQYYNGAERKIAILQQLAAAGLIPQEKADRIVARLQKKLEAQANKSRDDDDDDDDMDVDAEDAAEDLEDAEEEAKEAKEKAEEKAREEREDAEEDEREAREDAEEEAKDKEEAAREKQEKAKELEKKKQEKAAERAEKEREAKEEAAEKAKEQREKAEERAREKREKAAERAKEQREKAAERAKEEREKAAEKAKEERENDSDDD